MSPDYPSDHHGTGAWGEARFQPDGVKELENGTTAREEVIAPNGERA